MTGGVGQSITFKKKDDIREALLKRKPLIKSPKKQISRDEYAELSQNIRMMHQYYSDYGSAKPGVKRSNRLRPAKSA